MPPAREGAASVASAEPVLRVAGITKRFGALVANDDISLALGRAEVLALLGENGAGKSTLVSILFGHYVPDAGSIEVLGRALRPGDPAASLAAGIGMVHQHFTLADNLSVLDNVMLGTEPLWRPWSQRAAARRRLEQAASRFGLPVQPDARVGNLSVGERQRVEILKALVREARILILDEPTAVLTPQESERLFATLKGMVAQGLSLIFISHKLDEVLRVSDRIAVLRGGRLVATIATSGADKSSLAELMVGRPVPPAVKAPCAPGAVVAALSGVRVRGALHDIALDLPAGAITGIAGVSGNGQQALADLLCAVRAPDAGQIRLRDQPMPPSPTACIAAGIARIPEDRHNVGLVGDLPVWENAIAEHYRDRFAHLGWIRRGAARRFAQDVVQRYDVRAARGVDTPARSLSGGNMQKLILGRALLGTARAVAPPADARRTDAARADAARANAPGVDLATNPPEAPPAHPPANAAPVLIVANQPTWGLDVGAMAFVHQQLLDAAVAGAAVLLISDDLDEIFLLADRIAVIHAGRLSPARPAQQWSLREIGLAMAGAEASTSADPAPSTQEPPEPATAVSAPATALSTSASQSDLPALPGARGTPPHAH